jgi:Secretion system C-terminal sorting domain
MKRTPLFLYLLVFFGTLQGWTQNDWGIQYVHYPAGQIYNDPHIQFAFRITNYGPNSYPAGTVINTASRIVGTLFSLDLLGPGPSPITLAQDLGVGASFDYDPGYLDGAQTLAFFAVDTGEFCLIVYGTAADPVDLAFPNDPYPSNNMECLEWTNGQVITSAATLQVPVDMKLYPNPSSGLVTLQLPTGFKGELAVFSMLGEQMLAQEVAAPSTTIDLGSFGPGTYLYRLADARKRLVGHGQLIHLP